MRMSITKVKQDRWNRRMFVMQDTMKKEPFKLEGIFQYTIIRLAILYMIDYRRVGRKVYIYRKYSPSHTYMSHGCPITRGS